MFVGSKIMLSKFQDFDFSLGGGGGGQIDCVSSFKCLGVILLDQNKSSYSLGQN